MGFKSSPNPREIIIISAVYGMKLDKITLEDLKSFNESIEVWKGKKDLVVLHHVLKRITLGDFSEEVFDAFYPHYKSLLASVVEIKHPSELTIEMAQMSRKHMKKF